jgi:phage shock protein A
LDLLQQQLVDQEKEANVAINTWQDSYTAVEDKCAELEEKLQDSIDSLVAMTEEVNALKSTTAILEQENTALKVRLSGRQSLKPLGGSLEGPLLGSGAQDAELVQEREGKCMV